MRYFYEKPKEYTASKAKVYDCNHPLYFSCTLYLDGEKGLAVIQQRFDHARKCTWWSEIDPWLVDDIYNQPSFKEYFNLRSATAADGLYPTVTLRQIMHSLGMRPIQKARWETVFDRKEL